MSFIKRFFKWYADGLENVGGFLLMVSHNRRGGFFSTLFFIGLITICLVPYMPLVVWNLAGALWNWVSSKINSKQGE